MLTKIPFHDPVPSPTETPQPPVQQQPPPEDKPGRPFLVPNKPKGQLVWPADCLWPFTPEIGH